MSINFLLWIPVLVLLIYAPILCWLDIRYRDIFSHLIWVPAIVINGIFTVWFFLIGTYQWWTLALSLVGVIFWFVAMRFGIINGADFVYLALINLFVVFNPISGHLMYLSIMICLAIWTGLAIWYIFTENLKKEVFSNRAQNCQSPRELHLALIRTFRKGISVENGFPMMIPISLALITAVLIG
jgi:hypothetical protein